MVALSTGRCVCWSMDIKSLELSWVCNRFQEHFDYSIKIRGHIFSIPTALSFTLHMSITLCDTCMVSSLCYVVYMLYPSIMYFNTPLSQYCVGKPSIILFLMMRKKKGDASETECVIVDYVIANSLQGEIMSTYVVKLKTTSKVTYLCFCAVGMLFKPVYTRAPTSLDGVVKRLNAQVDAETGYEFEGGGLMC